MEVCSKILNLFIIINVLLNKNYFIESYSQVSRVGAIVSNNNNTNSEIIKHNPGREGVSSSDNDENNKTMSEYNDDGIPTMENKSTEMFTGRSSPSRGGFQFPLNFNTKPISYRRPSLAKSSPSSSSPMYVYPSYGSKSIDQTYKYTSNVPSPLGPVVAMDRFSPGEAYGFQQHLKNKKNNGYDYTPPKTQTPDKSVSSAVAPSPPAMIKPAAQPLLPTAPSSIGPVYQAPKDLYAFPPNVGSNYLPPYMKSNERPVTSYLPPAAGVPDGFGSNSFVGPINPKYLPSSNSQSMPPVSMPQETPPQDMPSDMSSQDMPPGMMTSDGMEMENHDHDHPHDINHDHSHDHDHPPSMGPSSGDGIKYYDYHNHDHSHDHSHDMPSAMMSNTPPPLPAPTTENPLAQMMAVVMEALKNNKNNAAPPPPSAPSAPTDSDITFSSPDHDHFHYHDHDHDHDYHGQHGVDAFPEIIYDHDPHDHHHDVVTTTTPAPPEEHMESRVKKYSYYYLGRKLWYIPLYFTLYFSFYVAALIMRSIGRHKVQWPNHYQKRSIDNISHKETVRKVEKLTNFVMNSIEDFKEKYL